MSAYHPQGRAAGAPLYLQATALNMSQTIMVEEAAAKLAERKAARVRPPKSQGIKPLLTDNEILEVRALSEFAGWACDALMLRYGVNKSMIQRVVTGITRSRLVASPGHLPAGVTAK